MANWATGYALKAASYKKEWSLTCCVGIETSDGKVVLATDSFIGGSVEKFTLDRGKLFKIGAVGFAYAGTVRVAQILEQNLTLPKLTKTTDLHAWTQQLAERARRVLKSHDALGSNNNYMDGCLLVAVHGKCYAFQQDLSTFRLADGYNAIGAGQDFAAGSLHSTRDMPPSDRASLALGAAAAHCQQVSEPFWFITV